MNDLYASRLAGPPHLLGVCVSEDVSVVGFDDLGSGEEVLMTVRQPVEGIGRAAAQTVLRRNEGPFGPSRYSLLGTPPVERSSARALHAATTARDVAR